MALKTAQSRQNTQGALYVTLTSTDPRWGTFIVYWGSSAFPQNNASTGKPVYPVIAGWGNIRRMLTAGGAARDASVSIDLVANAKFVLSNKTAGTTVAQFIREVDLFDLDVSIVQWNKWDSSQEAIWTGKWSSCSYRQDDTGIPIITAQFVPWGKNWENHASDLVTGITFPTSPPQGRNKIIPLAYGNFQLPFNFAGSSYHDPPFFGFPVAGIPGVAIKEDVTLAKSTVRFCKNDGTSAALVVDTGATNDLTNSNSVWLYDRDAGCYGMVDPASYVIRNTVNEVEADIDVSPVVHMAIVPTTPGAFNHFTSNVYTAFDSDPNNYVESTGVLYRLSFEMPRLNVQGLVMEVRVAAIVENNHATKNRKFTFGLWNSADFSGTPTWLNGKAWTTSNIAAGSGRKILYTSTVQMYTPDDCKGAVMSGNGTSEAFSQGSFLYQSNTEFNGPLELMLEVQDIGGLDAGRDGLRIFGLVAIAKVRYDGLRRLRPYQRPDGTIDKRGLGVHIAAQPPWLKPDRPLGSLQNAGIEYLMLIQSSKDDGSGTYTGTPSGLIINLIDVMNHTFAKRFGETVNTTAGTLGNFVDHRSSPAELANMNVTGHLGPDVTTREEAKRYFESKFPVRVNRSRLDNKLIVIADEMNPLAGRFYPSAAGFTPIPGYDVIKITGGKQLDYRDIQNNVTVQYHIGTKDAQPLFAYNYQHPLSVKLFGLKKEQVISEPWIYPGNVGGSVPNSVIVYAQWLGRKQARPRFSDMVVRLPQSYYDLDVGHVITFSKGDANTPNSLERRGIVPPFYRCGLMDYHLVGSGATWTDYADSGTPAYCYVAGGTQSAYFGFSQQIDQIDLKIAVASAYTGNAVHNYSSTAGFTSFAVQPTNRDAFKSTGQQSILYTLPQVDAWRKTEITLNNVIYGPCYWIRVDTTTPTVAGTGSGFTTYPARWWGRFLEVIEVLRQPGRNNSDYPFVEVVLQELM